MTIPPRTYRAMRRRHDRPVPGRRIMGGPPLSMAGRASRGGTDGEDLHLVDVR